MPKVKRVKQLVVVLMPKVVVPSLKEKPHMLKDYIQKHMAMVLMPKEHHIHLMAFQKKQLLLIRALMPKVRVQKHMVLGLTLKVVVAWLMLKVPT